MVTLFRKMLDAKFPPFARGGERVTDYNGIERIAVNMNEAEFQGKGELFDETDLAQLTKHIINIPFEIIPDKGGSPGIFIEFKPPEENDKYKLNFEGHVIKVFKPFSYPFIEYWLANRGKANLYDEQRVAYFRFAIELRKLCMERAKERD